MADTYSQISIHAVFAVQNRDNFIVAPWRDDLHKYIAGIINTQGAKSLAVGGWKDHVHIFFGMPVTMTVAEIMNVIKTNSSKWINEQGFIKGRFAWQAGYAAFSYARSQRDIIIRYIMNQEQHHAAKTFKEEYTKMLQDFEVEFNEKYVFEFYG